MLLRLPASFCYYFLVTSSLSSCKVCFYKIKCIEYCELTFVACVSANLHKIQIHLTLCNEILMSLKDIFKLVILFFTSHWCDELTSKEITNHFQEVRSTNKVLRYMSRGIARIVWGIYVDRFAATVGNFKPLTIVQKLFILDVCGVPDHEKILGIHTTNKGTHRNQ